MHPKCCVTTRIADTYQSLKADLDEVKSRISQIQDWGLSECALEWVTNELKKHIGEIKERMHDCIDAL